MLELLLLFGLFAFLISKLNARDAERLGTAHAQERAAPAEPHAPLGSLQRLTIADTERPMLASAAFVRAFGLDPRDVRDIRAYARCGPFETFPSALAALLLELHREGCAVGAETTALLFGGRALRDGEAVYFALTAGQPMPRVVAFLGPER
jgi:hypothetical protein